eukprot:GHVU01015124.1.p1 GENE.GHVU01015124.1~~GHVU01015124.1.p1  ORF type:complete len:107 (-),score=0.40 GHVU01015124.1:136-456(-)
MECLCIVPRPLFNGQIAFLRFEVRHPWNLGVSDSPPRQVLCSCVRKIQIYGNTTDDYIHTFHRHKCTLTKLSWLTWTVNQPVRWMREDRPDHLRHRIYRRIDSLEA